MEKTHDAKTLMIYGVDRKERAELRRIAADGGYRSVSEMIRNICLNELLKTKKGGK